MYYSLVIPAYNEAERIEPMLTDAMEYFNAKKKADGKTQFEVIVVNDCSTDKTVEVVNQLKKKYKNGECIRVLDLKQNGGKGNAVTQGMLAAKGEMVLFADADNATRFTDLDLLVDSLVGKAGVAKDQDGLGPKGIACGSRLQPGSLDLTPVGERAFHRTILMHIFHFCVSVCFALGIHHLPPVRDTQCGFKLFTRRSAKYTFSRVHSSRWAFDVELLMIALRDNHPISEVTVEWHEIEGSKVSLKSMVKMGLDLLKYMFLYGLYIW